MFNNDNVLLLFPFISEQDNCWPFLKCRGPFNAKWASVGGWLIGGVDLALTTNSFWRNKNTGSQCQRMEADDNYKHKKIICQDLKPQWSHPLLFSPGRVLNEIIWFTLFCYWKKIKRIAGAHFRFDF